MSWGQRGGAPSEKERLTKEIFLKTPSFPSAARRHFELEISTKKSWNRLRSTGRFFRRHIFFVHRSCKMFFPETLSSFYRLWYRVTVDVGWKKVYGATHSPEVTSPLVSAFQCNNHLSSFFPTATFAGLFSFFDSLMRSIQRSADSGFNRTASIYIL